MTHVSPCFAAGEAWAKGKSALPLEFSDSGDSDDEEDVSSDPDYKGPQDTSKDGEEVKKGQGDRIVRTLNIPADFVVGKPRHGKPGATRIRDPQGYELTKRRSAGDVTYWTCMTHRRYGCKVNAKTNGFLLESISGEHHHVERVHGNTGTWRNSLKSALKKELGDPESDVKLWNIEATFLRGRKDGTVLKDPTGHLMNRCRSSQSGSQRVYWRCKTHYRYGCKAKAITQGLILQQTNGKHHHIQKVHGNSKHLQKNDPIIPATKTENVNTAHK